jgi:uncharacterized protein (TIGR02246 family)
MRAFFALVLVASLSGCQSLRPPGQLDARSALGAWESAVNECDAEKVAKLYAPDAVLWGTVSPAIIWNAAGVRQYFERACAPTPNLKVVLGEQLVRVYGDTAINSGLYTFTVFPAGQPVQFPARYSFTYRNIDGRWQIVDHHSSAMPTPPRQ